jgi:hypothetical protein
METNGEMRTEARGFEWRFLDEVALWTAGVVAVVCVIGFLVTSSGMFVLGCVVCAAADISLALVAAHRAARELEAGRVDGVAPVVMTAGRLLVKAALLVAALLSRNGPLFWGAVAGVVAFDITLAFGGSVIAVRHGMRNASGGGEHRV